MYFFAVIESDKNFKLISLIENKTIHEKMKRLPLDLTTVLSLLIFLENIQTIKIKDNINK